MVTNKLVQLGGVTLAVNVANVSKTIGQHHIFNDINLGVNVGETIGIYGANGSGKSMLLRLISGLVLPDTGSVKVFDEIIGPDNEFPQSLGAMIDQPGFILEYSGMRNLELLASINNRISKGVICEAIEKVGLNPTDPRPVKAYSTGMRQRLGVAQAIMEGPKLLLLDEPTSALDENGSKLIHNLLREHQQKGVTMIIVSHNPQEIAELSHQVYQMRAGALLPA